ncbi:hypothetical protein [Acinetobacter sp. P1(2025)]|uniref:hypothetical protein n=1 Tax=Acinetobacter sp. P1(2025) TaxID=3446120 RepID=UPI003F529FBA
MNFYNLIDAKEDLIGVCLFLGLTAFATHQGATMLLSRLSDRNVQKQQELIFIAHLSYVNLKDIPYRLTSNPNNESSYMVKCDVSNEQARKQTIFILATLLQRKKIVVTTDMRYSLQQQWRNQLPTEMSDDDCKILWSQDMKEMTDLLLKNIALLNLVQSLINRLESPSNINKEIKKILKN